jgi:recombination protein RecT
MTDTTTEPETSTEVEKQEPSSAPAKVSAKEVLRTVLDRNADAVGASLPSGYSQDRFIRLLLTAANTNPELFECDPTSFLAAGVGAAQLGLEPNDARGLAYLVPFKDKRRGKVVQLIIGYRGMLDLARRSGMVTTVHSIPVFESDEFTYSLGLNPTLEHLPSGDDDPAKLIYVYAVAKVGGDSQFVVLNRRQLDKIREQYGRSDLSPWHTHFVEMAQKTAIRRLCKLLPQTAEMARAVEFDERQLTLGDLGLSSIDPDIDDVVDVETEEVEP